MDQSAFQIFATIVTSIVVEAMPFLLLGSLLGAVVSVYVGESTLEKLANRSLPVQLLLGCLAGLVLPTCECGVVPVVRRLLSKGVPPGVAIPFMLAAPVVNPISIASTYVAFQGDIRIVVLRVCFVLVPAMVLGWALSEVNGRELLRPTLAMAPGCACGCGHDDHHGHDHDEAAPSQGAKLLLVLRHTAHDFLDMGRLLVLGACAAGLFKVFLPQELLASVVGNTPLAIAAMMLVAVLVSVCSEADAFVAASLTMFPRSALLAFLALGPMLDLKLLPAYLTVFKRRAALAIAVIPACIIYGLALALSMVWGGISACV